MILKMCQVRSFKCRGVTASLHIRKWDKIWQCWKEGHKSGKHWPTTPIDKDAEVRLWWSAAIRQHQPGPNLHKQSGGRAGGLNLGLCPDKRGLLCHATAGVFYSFFAVLSMSKLMQSRADLAPVGKHPRHLIPVWPVPDSYGLFLSGICVPNSPVWAVELKTNLRKDFTIMKKALSWLKVG